MSNAIQRYLQRVQNKTSVFNADGKTLNLQELNRYVNGTSGESKPVKDGKFLLWSKSKRKDYVSTSKHSKTSGVLKKGDPVEIGRRLTNTLLRDIEKGSLPPRLVPVAQAMINSIWTHKGALIDGSFKVWLSALAIALPDGGYHDATCVADVPTLDKEDLPEPPQAFTDEALTTFIENLDPPTGFDQAFGAKMFDDIDRQLNGAPARPTHRAPQPSQERARDYRVVRMGVDGKFRFE